MVGVRFTIEERAALRKALDAARGKDGALPRHLASLLRKVEVAELTKRKVQAAPGIGARAAIQAMRGVLGNDLAFPPQPTSEWFVRMARAISMRGLTVGDCVRVAQVAAELGGPPYDFERLVYQSALLMKRGLTQNPVNGPARGASLPETREL